MENERRLLDSEKIQGRRLYSNKSHEANLHQPPIIPIFDKNFEERGGDNPFETIWRQGKILEYTASSILKRIRFLSNSPSLAMTVMTP